MREEWTAWEYGNHGVQRRRYFACRMSLVGRGMQIASDARGRPRKFERWQSAKALADELNAAPKGQ